MASPRPKTIFEHAKEVAHASVRDKKARMESSLLTNAVYTGLNVALSAIPFGKALIDDTTTLRLTQSLTGDKNFRILADQITPREKLKEQIRQTARPALERGKLLAAVGAQIRQGQQAKAQRSLQAVEQAVRRTAEGRGPSAANAQRFLNTWTMATRLAAKGQGQHPVLKARKMPTPADIMAHPSFDNVVREHRRQSERKAA